MAKQYNNFYTFLADYERRKHDFFFSHATLKAWGERLSEMRLLKGTRKITNNMGKIVEVYVISSYQHKAPTGHERRHHYFNVDTLDVEFIQRNK